jgi:hypothetical protein
LPNLVSQLTERDAVLAAIEEYDEMGRDAFLDKYDYGRSRRYLLRHDGREYDVKAIVGVAFGNQFPDRGSLASTDLTSGLRTTVPKLRELGFEIVEHGGASIGDALRAVMAIYDAQAKRGGRELDDLVTAIEEAGPVASRGDLKVVRSMGVGRWPNVAWLALLDPRETESTRRGVYPVYLFRSDLSGVYLTLNQGVEQLIDDVGAAQTLPALERRAVAIREGLHGLDDTEFTRSTSINLGPQRGKLARSYEAGCVVARFYPHDHLPGDGELESDLETLLSAYDDYLESKPSSSSSPGAPSDRLAARVERWKEETAYPRPADEKIKKERGELAGVMSEDRLLAAIDDPARFSELEFSRFAGQAAGGPGPMAAVNSYQNSGDDAKVQVAQAMKHLLYDGGELADRINDLLLREEWSAEGFKVALITKALWITRPDEWIPVFNVDGKNGKRALMALPELGIDIPEDLDDLSPGRRIEWTNQALRDKLRPLLPGDTRAQSEFLYWLRDEQPKVPTPESIDALAEKLFVEADWLNEVVELLAEKGQIIFQGPPGTGKTYVARELGRYFERLGGGCEIVQFHPSYSYEDFVEGYRPRLAKGGRTGFELTAGPLLRLAKLAEADEDHVYVLIIDELNRGNVAKVFGELYFLLEYRGERIRLQYSQTATSESDEEIGFALPRNLWIIATMNTADRSIALMDGALRRRFYFIGYFPDQPPVSTLLGRWLESTSGTSLAWLPKVLEEANRKLGDREAAIGPSHFMADDPDLLTEERIERIWRHAVLPYLEEQLIGAPDRLAEFSLPALRKAVEGAQLPPDAE